MILGIRTEVRVALPLEKVRPALLTRGWPWLGRPGLEGTREIELLGTMRRLKVVPLGVTALPDSVIAKLEVHSIGVLNKSQIKGEIAFQSNAFSTIAVFTGSAAAEAFGGRQGQDRRRLAVDLATVVLKKTVHDLELGQLASLAASPPPVPHAEPSGRKQAAGNNSDGGDR